MIVAAQKVVRKVAICGFGLIGGSIALDILRGRGSVAVHAFDRPRVREKLRRSRKFRVKVDDKLRDAVSGADLIILSASHAGIRSLLKKIASMPDVDDSLIIDTGAVKIPTVEFAANLAFAGNTKFLPSHPMAGRERSGFENAGSGLFQGHAWYLDSDVKLNRRNSSRLEWLLKRTKGVPVYISSGMHDEFVSEISHLPQLISTVLGAQIDPNWIKLAGPGLRSMLRLSGSPYAVWSEIIEENREQIIDALDTYADNVRMVKELIKKNKSLEAVFKAASRSYRCLS